MPTVNHTSSTNNANALVWSWSTKIEFRTDRKVSASLGLHSLVQSLDNLGTGVTAADPFTNLS